MLYDCMTSFNYKLTLYVMKTSMRKNERKTVAPYKAARSKRAGSGTVNLHNFSTIR